MARYEKLLTAVWTDPDLEHWRPSTRLLWIYLLTGPPSHGITGIYRLTERQIRSHTNLRSKQIKQGFEALGERVRRFPDCWIWIPSRFKYGCESENHWRSAVTYLTKETPKVPDEIVSLFSDKYAKSVVARSYQGGAKDLPRGLPPPTDSDPSSSSSSSSESVGQGVCLSLSHGGTPSCPVDPPPSDQRVTAFASRSQENTSKTADQQIAEAEAEDRRRETAEQEQADA